MTLDMGIETITRTHPKTLEFKRVATQMTKNSSNAHRQVMTIPWQ